MILTTINMLIWIIAILLSVALITLYERKLLASMQRRLGPDIVGILGILQPIADAIKLITKHTSRSDNSNYTLFYIAPIYSLSLLICSWSILISLYLSSNYSYSIQSLAIYDYQWLVLLAILSLTIYSILLLGWAANSSYAFIGSLRSSAALISYELILAGTVLLPILLAQSYNLYVIIDTQLVVSYIVILLPIFIIYYISTLAESSRIPFDLVEAESELVAGFMVEHSSVAFVLLFLAEYTSILLFSTINSILWLGSNTYLYLAIGISIMLSLVILARALLPRLRYDQLIILCWINLLPIVFVSTIAIPIIYITINS